MTITNHVLLGAIIGLAITEPQIALPTAFASHFAMDALPHFGYEGNKGFGEALRYKLSYCVGVVTALTSLVVITVLVRNSLWLALLSGLVAVAPDTVGVYNYQKYEKHSKKPDRFVELFHVRFHRAIQRCERPWGVAFEVIVCVGLSAWLLALVG